MNELMAAVGRLVDTATSDDERSFRAEVAAVLKRFEKADAKTAKVALAALGKAVKSATPRGAQVIYLTLGALVEGGANPVEAWTAIATTLPKTLRDATRFAETCVSLAPGADTLEDAIGTVGSTVAAAREKDAHAWNELPSRSLAAVACLTRSASLRKREAKSGKLLRATDALENAVDEVGILATALRVLDDEPLVVVHVEQRVGFRVVAHELASNAELAVLLCDALIGKGLAGAKPAAKAVLAVKNQAAPPKKAPIVKIPFEAFAWTALRSDGSLSEDDAHVVGFDGDAANIPAFGDDRVVLLRNAATPHAIAAEPTFPALHPSLSVTGRLTDKAVDTLLKKIATKAKTKKPQRSRRT